MKETFRLCIVLTIIAAVSAGVLAFISQKTEEPIAKSKLEEEMAAVRCVLPPFENDPNEDKLRIGKGDAETEFYRARKGGRIVGAAFSVTAPNGYSGEIKIMVGVDTAGVVQGIVILDHKETPGLGAKIGDEEFRGNYEGKSLTDPEKWDVEKDGGTFKQITGATISSRAVTHAVARGLEFFEAHREEVLGLKDYEKTERPDHEEAGKSFESDPGETGKTEKNDPKETGKTDEPDPGGRRR